MGKLKGRQLVISISAMVALAACEDGKGPNFQFLKKKPASEAAAPEASGTPEVTRNANSTALVQRDVEAPKVFSVKEEGLWDGRPSLGGVWIAHEDVKDPERVLIRNEANGKTVIGALFQRERLGPGPSLQLSSDAADALVVVAGAPVTLSVVALRKEEVPAETPETALAAAEGEQKVPEAADIKVASLDAPTKVTKKPGEKTAAAAAAAIKKAKPAKTAAKKPVVKPIDDPVLGSRLPKKTGGKTDPIKTAQSAIARSTDKPIRAIKAAVRGPAVTKPFIQIGIFSVKGNADNTATSLRNIGILPTVKEQTSKGKVFWRVVVGPATSSSERAAVLKKVKGLGFNDAYFVTN